MTSIGGKKKKTLTISKLRDQVWILFSRFIRLRDCQGRGYLNCYTCGASIPMGDAHAGHFKHGKNKVTYLMEDNVHGQCERCNFYLNGCEAEYALKLEDEIGRERVNELIELNRKEIVWKREELLELKEIYKRKIKELEY